MKIAITSKGKLINSKIDQHFARCAYFFIIDTDTNEIEIIKNISRSMENDVGLTVVQFLYELNVERIISGGFGIKSKSELDKLGIQLVVVQNMNSSIEEILNKLKTNFKK